MNAREIPAGYASAGRAIGCQTLFSQGKIEIAFSPAQQDRSFNSIHYRKLKE
jgi:hypothetical protein